MTASPPPPGTAEVWRIFVSYRRSELTTHIARWLKDELEREPIVSTTGQTFVLDVFVDTAEPHRANFQANLVPRLQHSRALIVLVDENAATRREPPLVDYLYEELDWWARERRSAPPIILQLDRSAPKFVEDPAFVKWRKVNFLPCSWETWRSHGDAGQTEQTRLLLQVRESIRTYGEIVHLEEVRRLRRRACIAAAFAAAALAGAFVSYRQSQESQRQRERAEAQTAIAQSESNAAALSAAHFASVSGDLQAARNWLDGVDPKQRAWEWFYLRGTTDTAAATLGQTDEYLGSRIKWEHYEDRRFKESELKVVASSPDGSLIAAGSEYGRFLLWDASTGKRLYDGGFSKGVRSLAFDPDGRSIAIGSPDGLLVLFDIKTKTARKLSEEGGVVSAVLYSASKRLIAASWDGSLTIWNTELRSKIKRYVSPKAAAELNHVADEVAARIKKYGPMPDPLFGPMPTIKLDKDESVMETEDRLFNLQPILSSFIGAAPTGDGHSVWAKVDGSIVRMDLNSWRQDVLTRGLPQSTFDLVPGARPVVVDRELVKRDNNYFEGRILRVWEPGNPEHTVDGRKLGNSAQVLGLSPDGRRLAVSVENRVDIYRYSDLSLEQKLVGHDLPVNAAAFLPDGSRLATASDDGHVKIWELERPKPLSSIQAHFRAVTALAFRTFAGEQSIITASEDGTVKSFPLRSLKTPTVLFEQKYAIRSISLSNDAKTLALARKGGDVAIIDLSTAAHPAHILTKTNALAVAFTRAGGSLLLAVDWHEVYGRFRLIDPVTGKVLANEEKKKTTERFPKPDETADVCCLAMVPSRDEFAWAADTRMEVGDAGVGTVSPLEKLSGLGGNDTSDYLSIAVSADSSLVAIGSRSGEIHVSTLPGIPRRFFDQLQGHLGPVTGLAFTSRGTRLVSGSEDGSIRIWDLDHERELLLIRTGSAVKSLAISPDGRTLAAGLADGTLRLWEAPGAPPN